MSNFLIWINKLFTHKLAAYVMWLECIIVRVWVRRRAHTQRKRQTQNPNKYNIENKLYVGTRRCLAIIFILFYFIAYSIIKCIIIIVNLKAALKFTTCTHVPQVHWHIKIQLFQYYVYLFKIITNSHLYYEQNPNEFRLTCVCRLMKLVFFSAKKFAALHAQRCIYD